MRRMSGVPLKLLVDALNKALGLVAAIPAVIFYNKFSADSAQISHRLEAFADEFAAIVSRQIDVRT